MKSLFIWVTLLLSILCLPYHMATAQNINLPATFTQLANTENLSDGCYCSLGMLNDQGNLVFIRAEANNKKKMNGSLTSLSNTASVEMRDINCVWQIKKGKNGRIALKAANGKGWLTRYKAGGLGLKLCSEESDLIYWLTQETSKGLILWTDPTDDTRMLSMGSSYSNSVISYVFDNYYNSRPAPLLVFKKPERLTDINGNNTVPENGSKVTLTSNNQVRTTSGRAMPIDKGLMLCNGTLVQLPEMECWQVVHADNETFGLKNAQGLFMNYNLEASTTPNYWKIMNGHICTTETHPRFLCFDENTTSWKVLDIEKAEQSAQLIGIAHEPSINTSPNGVYILKGGWSADALNQFNKADMTCLDLTQLSLPIHAKELGDWNRTRNIPVFIQEGMQNFVPDSWQWVVTCGTTNQLLRKTSLIDRQPFFCDRSFHINNQQISYTRQPVTPAQWQTLCLPFAAQVPKDTETAILKSITQNNLDFEPVTHIEAGVAYIIRCQTSQNLTILSKEGIINPSHPDPNGWMQGTMSDFSVSHTEDGTFMLAPNTNEFRQAAATSHLSPFRAWLKIQAKTPIKYPIKPYFK